MQRLMTAAARAADLAVQGHRRPGGHRARPARRPGRAEAPAAHQPRRGAAATAAQAAGHRGLPQPRGRRRRRATSATRTAAAPGCASARWSRAATSEPRCASRRRSCRSPSRWSPRFDREDPAYVLDVVSVVEAVLDDPRQILYAQQNAAKGAEVARLKAEGVPYEERMERLEAITWPQPLHELLDACFDAVPRAPPVGGRGAVAEVDPARDAGGRRHASRRSSAATGWSAARVCVLRYLTDAWRTLDRSLPDDVYTETLEDVIEWLGALIRATDATLLDEWAALAGKPVHDHQAPEAPTATRHRPARRMAHRRAHRGVRLGGAARPPRRTPRSPNARGWERAAAARRDGAVLGRVRRHRHRRRRPIGSALPSRRGAGPVGDHPAAGRPRRRRRVAVRRHGRPRRRRDRRARRRCGSTSSARTERRMEAS